MFSISDASCPRCHQSPATMAHMFWSCNSLNGFWTSIFEVYSYICNKTIDPNPYMAIFGVPSTDYNITSCQSNATAFPSLLAQQLILTRWKAASTPSFIQWIKEVMMCLKMKKLRSTLKGSLKKYNSTWFPFIEYVKNISFPAA